MTDLPPSRGAARPPREGERPGGRFGSRKLGLAALAWLVVLAGVWAGLYSGVVLPLWPAVARVVKELALLTLLLGAAYGWGSLALVALQASPGQSSSPMPTEGRPGQSPNPFFAFGLGFGVLWTATFVVAALHMLGPAWPWLLLASGWAALVLVRRRLPRVRLPAPSTYGLVQWVLILVMASSLAYTLLAWALVPPMAWDEVSYHLPIPRIWIDAGGFVSIPTMSSSNFPLGLELLHTLALLMGSEILPHLTLTAMTVLTVLGLATFARRWLDRDTAWLAAALYLSMPIVKYLGGIALVEAGTGFYGLLAVWAGYLWLEDARWRSLILAALLGGLAASIKLTNAAVPLAIAATVLVLRMLRLRRQPGAPRAWFWGQIRRPLAQGAVYGLAALAVASPWYVKSMLYTGNPVWPFLHNWLGGADWDALAVRLQMDRLHRPNLPATLRSYLGGLWYLTVNWQQFGGLSMGAATLALAPLSLLFWRSRRRLLGYLLPIVAVVYTAWFFAAHQTRHLMGIVPILALLAASGFTALVRAWPGWAAAFARAILLLYFVWGLPLVQIDQRNLVADRWAYLTGHESREQFLGGRVAGYAAFEYANEHLPPDAHVLLAPWETRGYYLERESMWANPTAQRVIKWEQITDPRQAYDTLREMGITHVFWNDELVRPMYLYETQVRALMTSMLQEYATSIYNQDRYAIYQLEDEPQPASLAARALAGRH